MRTQVTDRAFCHIGQRLPWCCDVGSRGKEDGSLLPRQAEKTQSVQEPWSSEGGASRGVGPLTSSFRNWDNCISVGFDKQSFSLPLV